MSLDDSQQEDCTVYIEELKSDNSGLKINAASKLPVIASVLGHNRIRDQLIPYLIQIIQQMDNQNQFLIKIAQGLFDLKQFCINDSESYILIPPLKILASLDQPSVREKAVESIKKLTSDLNSQFYEQRIVPLIIQMSDKKKPYSPRVSASCLISHCYPHASPQKQQELQKIFKRLGLQQNSPLVRRSVAENIEQYTRIVPKNVSKTDVLQIWQKFIVDKIDIVKIKALETASILARFFKKEEINDKIFKFIKGVDPDKKSWRVRYALAQCIASLLPFLQKQLIKKDCVEMLQQLLKDNQAQVKVIALLKIPDLAQKLSQKQSCDIFLQYVEKAQKDSSVNVKMALVQIIVPYLATIDKQTVSDKGISIITALIKDEHPSIRTGLIQRVKDLSDVLGEQDTTRYLLPLIELCVNDKKWRFKYAIAQSLKSIFKTLNYEKNKQFLDKIVKAFIKDHNHAVRQQTLVSLSQLKNILGSEKMNSMFKDILKGLSSEANCFYRITCYQSIKNIYSAMDKNEFNQLFVQLCKSIENQKVPNVIIAFLSSYLKVKGSLTGQSKKQIQNCIRKFKEIKDEDVQYFIEKVEEN